jgi:hypothetical protein
VSIADVDAVRRSVTEPPGRRRVLVAPVTITPTKPLSPSHLKGLFWTDVLVLATETLADVTYRYSHTTYHPCEQTIGFWEYLDRVVGDTDYSSRTEEEIGELYVGFRAAAQRPSFAACRPYIEAVERHGWTHPASARVLELWSAHYARLGLRDPGLLEHQPPDLSLDEAIDRLTAMGMCLDLRDISGPVYLDATRDGLPLRLIVAADGRPNYLACALRELLTLAPSHHDVVLLYDRGLEPDYLLLERVLSRLGTAVHRVPLGRVPIGGEIRSGRDGDWRGHHAGVLLDGLTGYDEDAVRLGLRLYFIAMLGPGDQTSFSLDLVERWVRRARRMLAADPGPKAPTPAEYLAREWGDEPFVDPYRLASSLLTKHRTNPGPGLLRTVFT